MAPICKRCIFQSQNGFWEKVIFECIFLEFLDFHGIFLIFNESRGIPGIHQRPWWTRGCMEVLSETSQVTEPLKNLIKPMVFKGFPTVSYPDLNLTSSNCGANWFFWKDPTAWSRCAACPKVAFTAKTAQNQPKKPSFFVENARFARVF